MLYEWAGPGSKLYYCDINQQATAEGGKNLEEFYKRVGQPIHIRTQEKVEELFGERAQELARQAAEQGKILLEWA